jgi:hypothetical protein
MISGKITILIASIIIFSMVGQAEALQQTATKLNYILEVGETQTLQWGILSDEDETVIIEFRAQGKGSELFSFSNTIEVPPHKMVFVDFKVTIPEDYQNDIELRPLLFALQKGIVEEGVSGAVINIEMMTISSIKIGNAPEFVAPVVAKPDKVDPDPIKEDTKPKETKSTDFTFDSPEDSTKECGAGTEMVNGICKIVMDKEPTEKPSEDGGCLIATATYGTELAPQVQLLREIRDNTLFSTVSGTTFMSGFNSLYYSFAPTVSDWERESPMFKEAVKTVITPMLSTLSIMSLADQGSEAEVLGLGISVITLNIGMYLGAPIGAIVLIRRQVKLRL